jgi:hypothetical protein
MSYDYFHFNSLFCDYDCQTDHASYIACVRYSLTVIYFPLDSTYLAAFICGVYDDTIYPLTLFLLYLRSPES